MPHVHRFRAVVHGPSGRAITKWKCKCGLKTKQRAVAEALDGQAL